MSNIAIRAENLGKSYLLGHSTRHKEEGYTALRDVLANGARDFARKTCDMFNRRAIVQGDEVEEFWALQNLNFDIQQGDRVGIIGRNGAGKSTLLKIFSRITEPTTGRVTLNGRVASLLEVGTGFHPELTGRENIYLNGAILGMSRAEVRAKFDEIVSFSSVEMFLDTPVKRYSSGMYVRLAFAVAAHLETDILVVDEVLAVGDAEFQKRCMEKMDGVGRSGRTVLFVSHNMGAVERLCNSALMLRNGELVLKTDDVSAAVRAYMGGVMNESSAEWQDFHGEYANDWFSPTRIYLGRGDGEIDSRARGANEPIFVYIEGDCAQVDPALQVGVGVFGADGTLLFWSFSSDDDKNWVTVHPGANRLCLTIPAYFLNEGSYRIELGIALYSRMWICEPGNKSPGITLDIHGGFLASKYWYQRRPGMLAPRMSWNTAEE
jgi:lipopolysaccharide transport system ATP-binding protein